jgi:hypothetical protein
MFLMICDAVCHVLITGNSGGQRGLPFRAKVTNDARQIHFVSDPVCRSITASREIDIGLFSAWLYQAAANSDSKKTTINGPQIPIDQADLAALIVTLIRGQEDQAENNSDRKNNNG